MSTAWGRSLVVVVGLSVWAVVVTAQMKPPQNDLAQYKAMLARLDTKTPACLETARKELEAFQGGHADSQAALRAFRQFYLARMREQEQVLSGRGTWEIVYGHWHLPPDLHPLVPHPVSVVRLVKSTVASKNPTLTSSLDTILNWPFAIAQSEGYWYLQPHAEWLAQVGRWYPGRFAEFLAFLFRESVEPVAADAAVLISWDELRQRIVRWDAFAATHADIPEAGTEVKPEVKRLLSLYLCGADNTPAYDRGTTALNSLLQASYRRFASDDRNVTGSAFVERLLAQLVESKFRRTPEITKYLNQATSPAPCGFR